MKWCRLRWWWGVLPALLVIVSGCTRPPATSPETLRALAKQSDLMENYSVGPGDTLLIEFSNMAELNRQLPVLPDGKVNLPIIGEFLVVDQTASELSESLTQAYLARIANAEVTVSVVQLGSRFVYVWGEVREPGVVVLDRPMRVSDAISVTGGMTDRARKKCVSLIRLATSTVYTLNLDDLLQTGNSMYNIPLVDRDVIYVPRGRF